MRQVDLGRVLGFFHQHMPRLVDKDFSDVRMESLFFAVDPALRGDAVVVQYDPFSPLNEVQLYTPAALLNSAGVTSGKREVIPNHRLHRLPAPLCPTISTPCGPNI